MILHRSDGTGRIGLEPFTEWIASAMNYNPRKVERFVFLFDHKSLTSKASANPKTNHQRVKKLVLMTTLDLKWPHVSGEICKNYEIMDLLTKLVNAGTRERENLVTMENDHFPFLKQIQEDRELMAAWKQLEDISPIPPVNSGEQS